MKKLMNDETPRVLNSQAWFTSRAYVIVRKSQQKSTHRVHVNNTQSQKINSFVLIYCFCIFVNTFQYEIN